MERLTLLIATAAGAAPWRVPTFRVTDDSSRLLAVLFGYACRNTTLSDYRYSGDYAGFAQITLETAHPEATALFMSGCGADANPEPRGKVAFAERHGKTLADAVDRALRGKLMPLEGSLRAAIAWVALPFVDPPSKEEILKRRGQGDIYRQKQTEYLLQQIETLGAVPTSCPCPIQVVRFGDSLTMIGLGSEAVVDYALRLRKEYPERQLSIAGYCNVLFGYLPSERILAEGGYEGGGAMVYIGRPGTFTPGVENLVIDTVKRLMTQCEQAAP